MMYLRLSDQMVVRSDLDFRKANPGTSMPSIITDGLAEWLGWSPVVPTSQPIYDASTQRVEELPPIQIDGTWTQQWQVADLTPEEIEQRRQQMVVSEFQAKAALLLQGLMPQVESLIEHPDTDPLVKLAWATARDYRRTSPSILGMAQALDWTDEQLDSLFALAATIDA